MQQRPRLAEGVHVADCEHMCGRCQGSRLGPAACDCACRAVCLERCSRQLLHSRRWTQMMYDVLQHLILFVTILLVLPLALRALVLAAAATALHRAEQPRARLG